MKLRAFGLILLPVAAALAFSGCGGGGGGGGGTVTPPSSGVSAGTDRPGQTSFSPNVTGANAQGSNVQIYAEERTGAVNSYDESRRVTMLLYGPVTAGETFNVNTTGNSGSATITYVVTDKQTDGSYKTTGTWNGNSGTVNVTAADGSHVAGTFNFSVKSPANGTVYNFSGGTFNLVYETPPPGL